MDWKLNCGDNHYEVIYDHIVKAFLMVRFKSATSCVVINVISESPSPTAALTKVNNIINDLEEQYNIDKKFLKRRRDEISKIKSPQWNAL